MYHIGNSFLSSYDKEDSGFLVNSLKFNFSPTRENTLHFAGNLLMLGSDGIIIKMVKTGDRIHSMRKDTNFRPLGRVVNSLSGIFEALSCKKQKIFNFRNPFEIL